MGLYVEKIDDYNSTWYKDDKLISIERRFECSCRGEQLCVNVDKEDTDSTNLKPQVNIAMLYYNNDGKHSFKDRIKYVWEVLRTGKIYRDQVILSNDKARDLANYILDNTKTE